MTWIKVAPKKWLAVSGPKRREFTFDPSKVCKLRYDVLSIVNQFLDWAPTPSASCIKELERQHEHEDKDSYCLTQGGCIVWPTGPNNEDDPTFYIDVLNYLDIAWSRPRLRTMDFGVHPIAQVIEDKWHAEAAYLRRSGFFSEGEFEWDRVPWATSLWIRRNMEKAWEVGLT